MKRLSIIFIIVFIFACTLHAGTTYFSPDGKVVSKQQFEVLQKEHAEKVQAAREKRKAEASAKQSIQKRVHLDKSGRPIPLDSLGRPIKTPNGKWITYPDQERHDTPQVTFVGHDKYDYGFKDGLMAKEPLSNDSDYLAGYRDGQRERDLTRQREKRDDKNDVFVDPYTGRLIQPTAGGAIDLETGAFCPKAGDRYLCDPEDSHRNNPGTIINNGWDTNGNHYTPAGGGNRWRQDGTFMQKAAGGYINTKTGKFVPGN